MMPTFSERQALAFEFADAVSRMRRCLAVAGMQVDDDDIVYAWSDYSDGLCAQWMALPDADCDLLAILKKHLPPPQAVWQTVVEDAGDGTRDGFVVLPNDLLTRLGWAPGDPLESVTAPAGMVILRRKE